MAQAAAEACEGLRREPAQRRERQGGHAVARPARVDPGHGGRGDDIAGKFGDRLIQASDPSLARARVAT